MTIIHPDKDDWSGPLFMLITLDNWKISKKCQVKGCSEKTNTIVCLTSDESPTNSPLHIGICERHNQESKKKGKFDYIVIL